MGRSIRKVESGRDIIIVEKLADEIWREHYTSIIGKSQVDYMLDRFQSFKAISDQIADGQEYYLIINDETEVGYIGIKATEERVFISKVYVLKSLRGSGLGSFAMDFIRLLANDRSIPMLELTVNKNNTKSIAAYEKMGFQKVEALVMDIGGGFVMDDYKMRLCL